jgi:hypothetical protein
MNSPTGRKIDQHMQQLAAQGVSEAHAIIDRMLGI